MTLTLYYSPLSCSLVPYIALTEAGAGFNVKALNMHRGEHTTAEFRRINPKQAVPVLLIDGTALTENVAIQIWIARTFREAHLLPEDPMREIQAISFLAWCASGIHPRLTPNVLPERYCDLPDSAQSVRRCAQTLLRANYAVAEAMLADGRNWFFEQFTTADVYFFWCFRRGTQFNVDVADYPLCRAHFERVSERPSAQRLFAFEKDVLARFAENS